MTQGPAHRRPARGTETLGLAAGFVFLSGLLALCMICLLCSFKVEYPLSGDQAGLITIAQLKYALNFTSNIRSGFDVPTYLAVLCAIFVPICGYVGFEKPRKLIDADQGSLKGLATVAGLSALGSAVLAWPYVLLIRHSIDDGFDGTGFLAAGVVLLASGMVSILPLIEYKADNEAAIIETAKELEGVNNYLTELHSDRGDLPDISGTRLWARIARIILLALIWTLPLCIFVFYISFTNNDFPSKGWLKGLVFSELIPIIYSSLTIFYRFRIDGRNQLRAAKSPNQRFAGIRRGISEAMFSFVLLIWLVLSFTIFTDLHHSWKRIVLLITFSITPLMTLLSTWPWMVKKLNCRVLNWLALAPRVAVAVVMARSEYKKLEEQEKNLRAF